MEVCRQKPRQRKRSPSLCRPGVRSAGKDRRASSPERARSRTSRNRPPEGLGFHPKNNREPLQPSVGVPHSLPAWVTSSSHHLPRSLKTLTPSTTPLSSRLGTGTRPGEMLLSWKLRLASPPTQAWQGSLQQVLFWVRYLTCAAQLCDCMVSGLRG